MTGHDDILDRIDVVLAGEDQAIEQDWAVGPDAMRSRPAKPADQSWGDSTHRQPGSIDVTGIVARAAQRLADREQAVARLAAVTSPAYAHEMRLATGGDVRQLDLITRLHSARGFNEQTRGLVRYAHNHGIDPAAIARAFDVPVHLVAGGLPEPRPNLRLQVIDALGLMPTLTRLATWLAGALKRVRPVLDRVDPRRRQPTRTVVVTLTADTSAFDEAMRRVGVTMAEGGANLTAAMNRLFDQRRADAWHDVQIEVSRNSMRRLGRNHLAAARAHLHQHVDDIYADLGLTRDPHLIRGEH